MMNITIAQRYTLEKELGAGGMGTVYRGIDTQTQQVVAIKHLKPQMAQPDMLERFRREGEALRDLNHPNIVKMLAALADAGNHYLIMEYVAGGDLATLLEKGKLPLEKMLSLAIDLADALTRAHKLNIVHRDLKPANVLIGDDGVLRLTDFGVAHVGSQQRVTDTDAIVGTIDYLPPEAFSGGTIDARADIWAFGVMLFEMLSHEKPFAKNTVMETVYAITTQPIPDLETLCPDAPIALIDLIYRMLERDPQTRIPSVRIVGAELEAIQQKRASSPALPDHRFDTPTTWTPPKHNIPTPSTPFVGREHELQHIAHIFANPDARLLTIVGQGGMGKTRLMLEVAYRLLSENELLSEAPPFYGDGIFFVELAPLSSPDNIVNAIADAMGYQFQPDERSPKQQLFDFLRPKHIGLMLDNFEHLLAGANLVAEILQAAPHVRITVTSRERLNLSGEMLFHLEGMDFPDWETPQNALEYSAVKLFMQGARRANPAFELKADDLVYVARICKLAQGMPLAIILAASWLSMLSVREIADEMSKNLDFLESDTRDMPERHRSMRAVFEYSWHLMSDAEKDVFAKLSVFRGGFTREAAEAVAGANLRLLMALVNKSLLRRDAESGRYEIHELLRQYGEEQLQTNGLLHTARQSHARYFAEWVNSHGHNLMTSADEKTLFEFEHDYQNIIAGWDWSVAHSINDLLILMTYGMILYFIVSEKLSEGAKFFTDIIEQITDAATKIDMMSYTLLFDIWANAHKHLISRTIIFHHFSQIESMSKQFEKALLLYAQVFYEMMVERNFEQGQVILTKTMYLFETLKETWWLAQCYKTQGYIQLMTGENSRIALSSSQTAYDLFVEIGAKLGAMSMVNNLSRLYFELGEIDRALNLIQGLNNERRRLKWKGSSMLRTLDSEGMILHFQGKDDEAIQIYHQLLAVAIYHNDKNTIFSSYAMLAELLIILKRDNEAENWLEKAVVISRQNDNDIDITNLDFRFGFLDYLHERYNEAFMHYNNIFEGASPGFKPISLIFMGLCQIKQAKFDMAQEYLLQAIAIANSINYYQEQSIGLYGIAELFYRQGNHSKSVQLAGYLQNSPYLYHIFKEWNAELLRQLSQSMPSDAYSAAIERGKSLDLETVVQDLLAEFAADDGM